MGSGALGGMNPAVCPGAAAAAAAAAPPGGGGGGCMLSVTISGERSNDTVGDVVRSFGGGVLGEEGDAGTGCRIDAARLSGETGRGCFDAGTILGSTLVFSFGGAPPEGGGA